jgi:L-fuculose-phosphate aldolase
MSQWQEEKKTVLETSRKMLDEGLVVGTAGNVSIRLPIETGRQLLAITPSMRPYDSLDVNDIQILDFETKKVEGNLEPSMETGLHIGIYKVRQDVNAIVHTHSIYASAISVAGLNIPPILDDQVVFLGGEIKVAGYAISGSNEQMVNVLAALEDRNAVLLANHGAVGTGGSIDEAFTVCELIEKTARIYLLALSAGSVNELPTKAIRVEKELYHKLHRTK